MASSLSHLLTLGWLFVSRQVSLDLSALIGSRVDEGFLDHNLPGQVQLGHSTPHLACTLEGHMLSQVTHHQLFINTLVMVYVDHAEAISLLIIDSPQYLLILGCSPIGSPDGLVCSNELDSDALWSFSP